MTITAAADGSALGNPGPAGWAWYVDEERWRAGGWPHGTNNMGELMAVIDLLESTSDSADDLKILCDSQYVIKAVTEWMPNWKRRGWRKADGSAVLNRDLLERLDEALVERRYRFEWVKGHAGHPLNEAADRRARAVATAYQGGHIVDVGPGWEEAVASDGRDEMVLSLFDENELDVSDDAATENPQETVLDLERQFLDPRIRSDRIRLGALLHPDFEEIGASGRLWSRGETIDLLTEEDAVAHEAQPLSTSCVDENTILVVFQTTSALGGCLRSSLWVRSDDGRWRLRFHQGTPQP